jgi:hypothetical protein
MRLLVVVEQVVLSRQVVSLPGMVALVALARWLAVLAVLAGPLRRP